MLYQGRNTWASLIATVVAMTVYVSVILQQAGDRPLTDVDWVPVMLWTIAAAIVLSILVGVIAGPAIPTGPTGPMSAIVRSPASATGWARRSW